MVPPRSGYEVYPVVLGSPPLSEAGVDDSAILLHAMLRTGNNANGVLGCKQSLKCDIDIGEIRHLSFRVN